MNRLVIIGNGFDLAHGLKTVIKILLGGIWMISLRIYSNQKKILVIMMMDC